MVACTAFGFTGACPSGWTLVGTKCYKQYRSVDACGSHNHQCSPVWSFCNTQQSGAALTTEAEFKTYHATETTMISSYVVTTTCQSGVNSSGCSGQNHMLMYANTGAEWGMHGDNSCCHTSRLLLCVMPSNNTSSTSTDAATTQTPSEVQTPAPHAVSSSYKKQSDMGCGYGGSCTDAQAALKIGPTGDYFSADGASIDACKETCNQHSECAGFNYQKTGATHARSVATETLPV